MSLSVQSSSNIEIQVMPLRDAELGLFKKLNMKLRLYIFNFLKPEEFVSKLSHVNKNWKHLSSSEEVWKLFFLNRYGCDYLSHTQSYRQLFIHIEVQARQIYDLIFKQGQEEVEYIGSATEPKSKALLHINGEKIKGSLTFSRILYGINMVVDSNGVTKRIGNTIVNADKNRSNFLFKLLIVNFTKLFETANSSKVPIKLNDNILEFQIEPKIFAEEGFLFKKWTRIGRIDSRNDRISEYLSEEESSQLKMKLDLLRIRLTDILINKIKDIINQNSRLRIQNENIKQDDNLAEFDRKISFENAQKYYCDLFGRISPLQESEMKYLQNSTHFLYPSVYLNISNDMICLQHEVRRTAKALENSDFLPQPLIVDSHKKLSLVNFDKANLKNQHLLFLISVIDVTFCLILSKYSITELERRKISRMN